jgi:hypothetical protein
MRQRGQVLELKTTGPDGQRLWACRYRPGGRDSKRLQRGGFTSAEAARAALERAIKRAERRRLHSRALTLAELVDEYLAQHDAQPETTAKLRWLLSKSICVFGARPIADLEAREIAHWRMALPAGHRFEATQALRQVLARAVAWGLLETNPAKVGVDNPPPKRREMLPFEPSQLRAVVAALGPRYGPMVLFAAATRLRPGEWLALEWRDIDLQRACCTSGERSGSTGSNRRRPTRPGPCRCSGRRSTRSPCFRDTVTSAPWCSPPPRAATWICTTGARAAGAQPSTKPTSRRCAGSTICATPSPPQRYAQA